jgi:putative nucleotidyltransferase with HDIG domain
VAVALFAVAVIVSELIEDADGGRRREPSDASPFRISAGLHVAAIVVVGPWAGGLIAALGTVLVKPLRGARPRQVAFEAAALALASVAGGYAFVLAGGDVGKLQLPDDLAPLAALSLVYLTVRTLLLDLARAREVFHPDLWTSAGEAGLGALVALFAIHNPWNLVALLPLVLVVHAAQVRLARVRHETLHALETFANIVDERDPSTYQHSVRVARYVDQLARALQLPFSDVDRLRWAARLHDLGKVAVDAAVLRKEDRLDGAEWAAMRRHPRLSARLLQRFEFAAGQARAVEYHHERFDGRGYYGIDGGDLPLASHFLIVADSFDAMTTERPFRPALSRDEALGEIERNSGTQFHPAIANAFVAVQRGQDPATVLTPAELAEIRDAVLPYRLGRAPGARDLRERPELFVVGGVAAALVGAGTGERIVLGVGIALAVFGVAFRSLRLLRVRRLTGNLMRLVRTSADRGEAFDRVSALLERTAAVTWTGLVGWHEDSLGGAIERQHGADPPLEPALMSWLVRQAESGESVLRASGLDLSREGVLVALPLHRENSALVGFLVLAAPRQLPGHVELALRSSLDELGLALAMRPASLPSLDMPRAAAHL